MDLPRDASSAGTAIDGRASAELLYGLAAAVNAAERVDEVFDAALESIQHTHATHRAAILTFDPDGVMRFKAWRGLSDGYRRAVEGHSPWPRDARAPQPIFVADVDADEAWAPYRAVFAAEGIRALGFIPLVAGGTLLGKFMVYYERPHAPAPGEVDEARAIASHVGAAIARFAAAEALSAANASLAAADARKNHFLAVLAHELRNPLAPLRSAVDLLLQFDAPDPRIGRAVSIMDRQLGQLTRLVDDLLDVSRIVRGNVKLQLERLELGALLRDTVEDHRPTFSAREQEIALQLPTAQSWIRGDSARLSQVVGNLLVNASKFTPPRGRIEVGARREDDHVVAWVADDGEGMTRELMARVFQPFAQGSHGERADLGLGLGLALARGLVELHGGSIRVDSPGPSLGSTFTLRLPLAP